MIYNNGKVAEFATSNVGMTTAESNRLDTYLAIKYGQTLTHNYFSPNYSGSNAATETLYDVSTYGNRITGIGKDVAGCLNQKQSKSVVSGNIIELNIDVTLAATNALNAGSITTDRSFLLTGDNNNGVASWSNTWTTNALGNEKPAIADDLCQYSRLSREWKITSYGDGFSGNIQVFDNSSTNTTKLPALPGSSYVVALIANDNPDFSVNANQAETIMTFNATSKTWDTNLTVPIGTTRYFMFSIRKKNCAKPCVPVNPATTRSR